MDLTAPARAAITGVQSGAAMRRFRSLTFETVLISAERHNGDDPYTYWREQRALKPTLSMPFFHDKELTMGVPPSLNSPMRILIADPQLQSSKAIDKALCKLGYFRVCSVNSFEELTLLTHYNPSLYERFDLLIINAKLLADAGIDAAEFCVNNSRLRNVLIHGAPQLATINAGNLSSRAQHRVQAVVSFNHPQVNDFLAVIAPPATLKKLYALAARNNLR